MNTIFYNRYGVNSNTSFYKLFCKLIHCTSVEDKPSVYIQVHWVKEKITCSYV